MAIAVLLVTWERLAVRRYLARSRAPCSAHRTIRRRSKRTPVGRSEIPDLRMGYWTDDIGYVGSDGLPLGDPSRRWTSTHGTL